MPKSHALPLETRKLSPKILLIGLLVLMGLLLILIWRPSGAKTEIKPESQLVKPKLAIFKEPEFDKLTESHNAPSRNEQPIAEQPAIDTESLRLLAKRRQAPLAIYKSDNARQVMLSEGENTTSVTQAIASKIEHLDYTIIQGKIISGILETAINSDLPGFLRAMVKEDVYSEQGGHVLIPKGSRLIGQYQSDLDVGQKRVFITWDRLVRPDGIEISLNSAGTNRLGQSGLSGHVNTHFKERFGEAVLLSLIAAGSSTLNVGKKDEDNSLSSYREAISNSFADSAGESFNRTAGLGPTINIPQGVLIKVFVAQDLNFYQALQDIE